MMNYNFVFCLSKIFHILYLHRYCREGIHLTESIIYHQPCLIPQDCDVNEWSSWKLINSSCMDINGRTIVGKMRRYRSVLQVPRGSGKPCPPLEETTEVQGTDSRKCPRYVDILTHMVLCLGSIDGFYIYVSFRSHRGLNPTWGRS